MSQVHDRYDFYRAHGPLTPELVEALGRLRDLLLVSEVMEGPRISVRFEVPPELDADFQAALASQDLLVPLLKA